jgi:hypothetical protein
LDEDGSIHQRGTPHHAIFSNPAGGEMKPQRKLSRQSANHEITR